MIQTSYPISQFHHVGYSGITRHYPINSAKFSLKVTQNEKVQNKKASDLVSTNVEDIISKLENGNKDAINILESLGLNYSLTEYGKGYKIKFEQDGNKYTVAYNGEKTILPNTNNVDIESNKLQTETVKEEQVVLEEPTAFDYQTSVNDLYANIERIESENRFKEFNNDIITLSQEIESYKNEQNADSESYDALNTNLSQILDRYGAISLEQSNLLDEKENIQNQINNLLAPKPVSKEDYVITNILPDGNKETVVDEAKYSDALEQYKKDMEEYSNKNQELTVQMEDIISKLKVSNIRLDSLDALKLDIKKDLNSVKKLQSMINNSKNVNEEQNLQETQKMLSTKIQANTELRAKALQTEIDFEDINIDDYTSKEYSLQVKSYNKQISAIQKEMECNDVDIQGILFNADLFALISELDTNGTGSKAMYKIIADSTNEYNQILEAKKRELNRLYYNRNSSFDLESPEVRSQAEDETDEEFIQAMNLYKFQSFLYEKRQQEAELKTKFSQARIEKMDKKLEQIQRMLFGTTA